MTQPLRCSAVLTHHWLVRRRGGERVLEALRELLPDAPIYTLVSDAAYLSERAADAAARPLPPPRIVTSLLRLVPGAARIYPALLPLMPMAARRMRLPPVDLVVCSDAALAKAMRADPRSRLVCYCHSPMRYAWDPELSRHYAARLPRWLRPAWRAICARARRADYRAAQCVDVFVANSRHVAERIRNWYGRESRVVYPPVDVPPSPPRATPREDFYLCVGHHVPYKRLDLAVDACAALDRRLVVIGVGPEVDRLRATRRRREALEGAIVAPGLTLLGYQPDEVVRDHYARARALIFPGQEDFGIVPLEAMAHGCPVVAYRVGGACETVLDGVTGALFDAQDVAAVVAALRRIEAATFDARALHAHALTFSRERFLREMRGVLEEALALRPPARGPGRAVRPAVR